jgi:hypothetical protein
LLRRLAMTCSNCRREREKGQSYRFYYGKKGHSTTAFEPGRKVTTTPISIAGEDGAWICDACVDLRQRLNLAAVAGLFIMVVASIYSAATEGNTANVYACSALALIVAVAGPISVLRRRQDTGESLAIKSRKGALKAAGFDTFLTTRRYQSIRAGG